MPTNLSRVRVSWQNWPGAPGVSTFYYGTSLGSLPTQAQIDGIRTFFNTLSSYIPSGLTINVPNSGDQLNWVDGKLTGTWSVPTAPATVTGSGTGNYAGNAGAVIHWLTTDVVNGHRVRGRTFIVPLVSTVYDTGGSLSTTFISALNTAGTTLVGLADGPPAVWARPFTDKNGIKPHRDGSAHQVSSTRVPDLAVSQRSRRI